MTQKLHVGGDFRAVWEGWFGKMNKANDGIEIAFGIFDLVF